MQACHRFTSHFLFPTLTEGQTKFILSSGAVQAEEETFIMVASPCGYSCMCEQRHSPGRLDSVVPAIKMLVSLLLTLCQTAREDT